MTFHLHPYWFLIPGWAMLAIANAVSFLCIKENFSKDDKAGLASVMLFIPIIAISVCAFLVIGAGGRFEHFGFYILPALCVLDAIRKFLR